MAMEGYIKTYRSILKWEWYTEPNVMRLFTHCLLKANFQETKWKGNTIPCGSFITSRAKLALELDLTEDQIRYAIECLKSTSEITTKTTNKYTQINVVNWAKYQSDVLEIPQQKSQQSPQPVPNQSPTSPQQIPTDKELKELKNIRIKEEVPKDIVANAPTLFGDTPIAVSQKRKPKVFVPPTLDEVKAYAKEKNSTIDTKFFYDFFNDSNWIDSLGMPVISWKQKFVTWDKKEKEKEKTKNETIKKPTVLTKSYGDHY